jgi:uncharacterized protein DUF2397
MALLDPEPAASPAPEAAAVEAPARPTGAVLYPARTRLTLFSYTVEPLAPLYRAVMRAFLDAKARYRIQFRPDEIAAELRRAGYDDEPPEGGVDRALDRLVEWGNLRRSHDTGRVTTLEDFRRRHFIYQMTAGEVAERAVGEVLDALERSGSLQRVMLGTILRNLDEIARELGGGEPRPESFERLDNDQKELARTEAAAASVSSFVALYREYGRGIARGRAAEVRQSDSRYHKIAGEVREAEAEGERLAALLAGLAERARQADSRIEAARGTLRALEQSQAMRSAEALRAKREHAESLAQRAAQDRDDALREERLAAERRRELEHAGEEAGRAARKREEDAGLALAAAREAGLEAVYAAALAAFAELGSKVEATVAAAVRQREEGIAELRGLAKERDRAQSGEERARERLREADAQMRAAVERSAGARAEVERQRDLLAEALRAWWQGLAELRLDAAAVAEAARPQRDALVRERTAVEAEAAGVGEERRATAEERRAVAAARELGPEPPRTRASDRSQRAGAPLYLLCEFAPGLAAAERAGLEAALEASGVLDAWVMPDGAVLAPGTLDTFLVPVAGERAGGTLADLLVAAPGHGVARATVEAVLRSIEVAAGAVSVGADGTFRLGPLAGAWSKPVAEHVGAGAREAARQRRLAELAAKLADLDRALAGLAARGEELGRRLERLGREVDSAPPATDLLRARHQAEAAAADERRRHAELAAAEATVERARAAREDAERRLDARARELGLAAFLDDLEEYRVRLHGCAAGFRELVHALEAEAAAAARSARARRLLAEAESRQAEVARRAEESAGAAAAARAEHAELEATVGVEAREVVERHRAATLDLKQFEMQRGALAQEAQAVREQRARADERLVLRRGDLAEREAERARAAARLARFVAAGLLPLVVEEAPEEPLPAWSLTRALDLARQIERAAADVDLAQEAANRRANRLHERFRTLAADLGADYQPSLDQDEDLAVVRVGFNGRDHDVAGLLAALRESIEVRRALLAEHERELLRRFLLGEVGDHLRHRLLQAREHVEHMNELLAGCRTASGMALKLAWKPRRKSARRYGCCARTASCCRTPTAGGSSLSSRRGSPRRGSAGRRCRGAGTCWPRSTTVPGTASAFCGAPARAATGWS